MKSHRDTQSLLTVRRALQRAIRRRESVRVERTKGMCNIYGFPLALGKKLLLLQKTDDFRVDGYSVLPLEQITAVPLLRNRRFADRVVRDLGRIKKVKLPAYSLRLDNWAHCSMSLAAAEMMVINDCELESEDWGSEMFLGPILAVSDAALVVHHIDVEAKWFENPEVVAFADITEMRFDDEYSKVYERYAPGPRPDSPIS